MASSKKRKILMNWNYLPEDAQMLTLEYLDTENLSKMARVEAKSTTLANEILDVRLKCLLEDKCWDDDEKQTNKDCISYCNELKADPFASKNFNLDKVLLPRGISLVDEDDQVPFPYTAASITLNNFQIFCSNNTWQIDTLTIRAVGRTSTYFIEVVIFHPLMGGKRTIKLQSVKREFANDILHHYLQARPESVTISYSVIPSYLVHWRLTLNNQVRVHFDFPFVANMQIWNWKIIRNPPAAEHFEIFKTFPMPGKVRQQKLTCEKFLNRHLTSIVKSLK